MNNNDEKVVNSIRALAIDMIDEAKSGHPGIALGAAPIIYTLYANHLRFSGTDDKWLNRDRFILSAGHGSALLYATLYMAGFDISLDELKHFRKLGSLTPGHPEYNLTPGVDCYSGVLGQGIATAVGMAIGERYLANYIKKYDNNQKLINYYTYVLAGDGDLMEGMSYEACSFAGTQKLNKLIILYDSNNVSLDGPTNLTFTENVIDRFKAMGWHTELVKNGENLGDISKAIENAKAVSDKPSIIEIKTTIGYGSFNAGKHEVHGKPLSKEDIMLIKEKFGLNNVPFNIRESDSKFLRDKIKYRMDKEYTSWASYYSEINNQNDEFYKSVLNQLKTGNIEINFNDMNLHVDNRHKDELRNSNYHFINFISRKVPYFIGGSADVISSTKTFINTDDNPIMSSKNPLGKSIYFGVREQAMSAILNGLAISGLKPFGSTFLVFSDYMKPAIRLAAMYNLPVTYIFTHDSITVGEDGPTHQPIEQLASLRSIPNLMVFHPGDIIELYGCWNQIMKYNGPVALVISKNDATLIPNSNNNYVAYGAYLVRKEGTKLDGILISSGTDVKTCYLIADDLAKKGLDLRVISMPSIELYLENDVKYKESLLPNVKKIIVSSSSSNSWYKIVPNDEYHITINSYGYSGTKDEVLEEFEFSYEQIKNRVERLIR